MLRAPAVVLGLALLAAAQTPVHLDLRVQSGGGVTVLAAPGATLSYEVVGELGGGPNLGLGLFGLDLTWSGGPLAAADTPISAPMNHFAEPLGVTNPSGFGGTAAGQSRVQIGGGQNTFVNVFAPVPFGPVITNVAAAGSPQVLVTGSISVPNAPGAYALSLSNVFANVIRAGETGVPLWRVDACDAGTLTHLTILVEPLRANTQVASIAGPGMQVLSFDAGSLHAGRAYWTLGSVTGTTPGLSILPTGTPLPLNEDWYLHHLIAFPNTSVLANSMGNLDGAGSSTITFLLPAGLPPGVAGVTLHHAVVLLDPVDFASNAVAVTLVP